MQEKSLYHTIFKGLAWNFTGQFAQQGATFVIGVILARILSPREFGLMTMVTVVINFAQIFVELGLGTALIQRKNINTQLLSTIFWLNLSGGVILTIGFFVVAPHVAVFYSEPELGVLTRFISIIFIIGSFGVIQKAIIIKRLDFQRLSYINFFASVFAGSIAIIMAWYGFGVWSLAVQSVTSTSLVVVMLWLHTSWYPKLTFHFNELYTVLDFSLPLLGTQIINYWTRNIDYLLIGRVLNTNSLGVYSRAYGIMNLPLNNISRTVTQVMFPSWSAINNQPQTIKRIYLKTAQMIALITFPLMLGVLVVSEEFILTLYGERWLEIVPVLRILCVVGMIQSIITLNGSLFLSQNRTAVQFKIGLLLRANSVIGIIIGLNWGIIGVATGYAVATIINMIPSVYFAGKAVGLTFTNLVSELYQILFCAIAMAVFVIGLQLITPSQWPVWLCLIIYSISGCCIYIVCLNIFSVVPYNQAKVLISQKFRSLLK